MIIFKSILCVPIFIIITCSSLHSQILVQNFQNDAYFGESPQTVVRSSGIGNYGFDSDDMFFNPKYSNRRADFIISLSSLYSLNSGVYQTNTEIGETRKYSKNIEDIDFDFTLKYKDNKYEIHFNYFTNLYFRQRGQNGLDVLLYFDTYNGPQNLLGQFPEYYISNKILQFAVSRQFENLSITAGFLTNRYIYKIVLDKPYVVELKSSFLENFQLLLSINYQYNNYLRFYLLGRTENSEIELIPNIEKFKSQLIIKDKLLLSFPGIVAYGIQYNVTDQLKLSVEMCHDFLSTNDDPKLYKRWTQKLFTSELAFGINYTLFGTWEIGGLYSMFLDYDSGVRFESHVVYQGAVFFPLDKLNFYKAATRYTIKDWTFQLNYQYGVSEYDLGPTTYLQERSQLLKFGVYKHL